METNLRKRWFKFKFVLFGMILMSLLILFSERNEQGTPQAVSLTSDFITWFMKVPGAIIAVLVAFLFVRGQVLFWKEADDKKEAIKSIAKDLGLVIGGTIFIGLLIGFINVKLGVV